MKIQKSGRESRLISVYALYSDRQNQNFLKKDFSEISGSIMISSVRGNTAKYSEVQTSEVYMPICMLRYDK